MAVITWMQILRLTNCSSMPKRNVFFSFLRLFSAEYCLCCLIIPYITLDYAPPDWLSESPYKESLRSLMLLHYLFSQQSSSIKSVPEILNRYRTDWMIANCKILIIHASVSSSVNISCANLILSYDSQPHITYLPSNLL